MRDMKKAKFIINEASATKDSYMFTESVIGCLAMNQIVNHVDVVYTKHVNDAMIEAKKMLPGEYDFVTAVGGDGTVHDVINGVLRGKNQTPIAVIPTGTGNDFANLLKLRGSKESFCRMIKHFEVIESDVGKVNDRYFINSAGAGFGMNTAFDTPMRSKAVLGKMAYAIEGALTKPSKIRAQAVLKFTSEELCTTMSTALLIVNNAGSLISGRKADQRASLTKGYLDVLAVKRADLLRAPGMLMMLKKEKQIDLPGIKYFRTTRVDISKVGGDEFSFDFDKERFGSFPVHIELVPKAIKILVPPAS